MAVNKQAAGLTALRIGLGVFFVFEGIAKLGWIVDSGILTRQLQEWLQSAPAWSRWYLQTVAIPGAAIFARAVSLGELALGLGLLVGVWARLGALLGFLMVLNFHFASGRLFHYAFLTNSAGLPILGGLLALAIGGSKLPWSLRG
jgi:thiosulfate dehydrogenase [quinone] large subunit